MRPETGRWNQWIVVLIMAVLFPACMAARNSDSRSATTSSSKGFSCEVNSTSLFPGDPLTVTAVEPNSWRHTTYSWSINGVALHSAEHIAAIDTSALAPGSYTVQGRVRKGLLFRHPQCSAQIQVRAYEPPTVSCSITPKRLQPGEEADIQVTAISPQNRPLKFSYSASSGTISGEGRTATYNSSGASTGVVDLSCNVKDDQGNKAGSSAQVTIVPSSAGRQSHALSLCSVSFEKDKRRPTRVDNEAKACLDDVALSLQKSPEARVVVVGESSAAEKASGRLSRKAETDHSGRLSRLGASPKSEMSREDFAAERAVNTKEYLVKEKGIDASRIVVTTRSTPGQKVENYLVPEGASLPSGVSASARGDERVVKPTARKNHLSRHTGAVKHLRAEAEKDLKEAAPEAAEKSAKKAPAGKAEKPEDKTHAAADKEEPRAAKKNAHTASERKAHTRRHHSKKAAE